MVLLTIRAGALRIRQGFLYFFLGKVQFGRIKLDNLNGLICISHRMRSGSAPIELCETVECI